MQHYEPFDGVIARTQAESQPWWPTPPHPGRGRPQRGGHPPRRHRLLPLRLLRVGPGHAQHRRPGRRGLRYTNFHVTPLCSPTRAALLTGRNHHTVGMRAISNFDSGYPHMRGHITDHATTMAEVLRDEGYATFAVGKWHLCAMENASAAGPYDQWPCQRGFDRFYGFLEGETDQFSPGPGLRQPPRRAPGTPDEGYHLSEDLVDHAIALHPRLGVDPSRPPVLHLPRLRGHARPPPGPRRAT